MSLSLPKAQLIALCLSTLLYGMFFTLVLITTVVMLYKATDDIRRQRVTILPVSYAMLVVATLHFVTGWVRAVYGFVDHKDGSALAFYAHLSDSTSLLRTSCVCLQSVMGDGIIMWRLYIVYGRRFRIVIPAIILVTLYSVIGIIVLICLGRVRPGTTIFNSAKIWITAYFSLTMTTNVLLSGAIAWRIFRAGNPLRGSRPHWLIIFTLIESCTLYTFSIIAALVTFLSHSYSQYAAVDAIVPMVGIGFSLIVLQIRFHVSASASQVPPSDPRASAVFHRADICPFGDEDPKSPVRTIIRISRQVDTELKPYDVNKNKYHSSLDTDTDTPNPV